MRVDAVAGTGEVHKDLRESFPAVGAPETADILSDEPFGTEGTQDTDTVRVERAVRAGEPLLLPDGREVVAGKAEGESIERMRTEERVLRTEVKLAHVPAEDAAIVPVADILAVRRAGIRIKVSSPCMADLGRGFFRCGTDCPEGKAAGSREEFPECVGFHHRKHPLLSRFHSG